MQVAVVKPIQRKTIEKLLRTHTLRQPEGATLYLTNGVKSVTDANIVCAKLDIYKKLMGIETFKKAFEKAKNKVELNLAVTKQGIVATVKRYMETGQECKNTVKKGYSQPFVEFASKVAKTITQMGNKPEPEIRAAK